MMTEIRDAIRALRAAPVVTAVAMVSLALGVGANTAIFSLVNSLMLRSLPVERAERLALIEGGWTNPIWEEIRQRQDDLFDGAIAWSRQQFDLAGSGESRLVDGLWVSGEFFDVLGVPAILGRTITNADDVRGGGPDGPVTVISHRFWQQQFGGSADAIGRSLRINRVAYTIIGVAPPGFFGPEVGTSFDVAIPIGTEPLVRGAGSGLDNRSFWWIDIIVRLKPGQSLDAATALLRGAQPQIRAATLPENWRPSDLDNYLKEPLTLVPAGTGASPLRARYERPLLAVMVVVCLVLLIACANLANLMLARANARRHEMTVRVALGASRIRLARQMLIESLTLSVGGAAAGIVLAIWGSRLIVRQLSTSRGTVFLDLSLDWRVLAFTAAVAIATAVLFGTAPAIRTARVQPNDALKEHGRGFGGEGRGSLATPLVVAQVALSLVLVVAAGLFVRTFLTLANRDLGFNREPILVVAIDAEASKADDSTRADLFERIAAAVASTPGIERSAASAITPVSGMGWNIMFEFPGLPALSERDRIINQNFVTPGWFSTYETTIISGRDFTERDHSSSPSVAIVNEAFLRKYMSGGDALGRTLRTSARPDRPSIDLQIVGVVEDAVYRSVREPARPIVYRPLAQADRFPPFMSVSVRASSGSPAALTRSIVEAIGKVDRNVRISFRPLAAQVNDSLAQERVLAILSGFFGMLALLLAAIGLYGVTTYAVSRRRREIGIRIALGANTAGVVALVLRRVTALVSAGVAIGIVISMWAARLVGTMLYGLEPGDPATLAVAAFVLAGIGALAGWVPARRASRIDPAEVLREG